MSFRVKNEKCHFCEKSVYAMDRMAADNIVFHKGCMKCEHCQGTLSLGNFAALNGKYYCKPHFKQLFQTKGNYSDGFGEDKPTAKWENQAAVYASATPGANFTKPASSKGTGSPLTKPASSLNEASASNAASETHSSEHTEPQHTEPEQPTESHEPAQSESHVEESHEESHASESHAEPEVEPEHHNEPETQPEVEPEAEEEPVSLSDRMSSFKVEESDNSPVTAAKTASPSVSATGSPLPIKKDACAVCGKTVYAMEKMVADNVTFHKNCMKCTHCNKTLGLGNFAALNGKYYCKPHFKQLFQTKGNYSDGFGEDLPTAKWEAQAPGYATGGPKKFF